jgi:hypothetical protein
LVGRLGPAGGLLALDWNRGSPLHGLPRRGHEFPIRLGQRCGNDALELVVVK